jgi:uncharacterized protein YdcH (DUF465 family)
MDDLTWFASLIKSRNTIDDKIAGIIGHSSQANNIADYIASMIFRITRETNGKERGYTGRFTHGPLNRRTVDVQWRLKDDHQLSVRPDFIPDYYLVFAGPANQESDHSTPWQIASIYLFDGHNLLNALIERKVQLGSNASVTGPLWDRAEIYPRATNTLLVLGAEERQQLGLFHA